MELSVWLSHLRSPHSPPGIPTLRSGALLCFPTIEQQSHCMGHLRRGEVGKSSRKVEWSFFVSHRKGQRIPLGHFVHGGTYCLCLGTRMMGLPGWPLLDTGNMAPVGHTRHISTLLLKGRHSEDHVLWQRGELQVSGGQRQGSG